MKHWITSQIILIFDRYYWLHRNRKKVRNPMRCISIAVLKANTEEIPLQCCDLPNP